MMPDTSSVYTFSNWCIRVISWGSYVRLVVSFYFVKAIFYLKLSFALHFHLQYRFPLLFLHPRCIILYPPTNKLSKYKTNLNFIYAHKTRFLVQMFITPSHSQQFCCTFRLITSPFRLCISCPIALSWNSYRYQTGGTGELEMGIEFCNVIVTYYAYEVDHNKEDKYVYVLYDHDVNDRLIGTWRSSWESELFIIFILYGTFIVRWLTYCYSRQSDYPQDIRLVV